MAKIILFDAVGTLFGVRDTVGEVYQKFASEWGVDVSPAVSYTHLTLPTILLV